MRLTRIDDSNRGDHANLETTDKCFFVGEYISGKGREAYKFGKTNELISNLKKGLELKETPQWKWKAVHIRKAGLLIRKTGRTWYEKEGNIVVPVPPSKTADDPLYDDRLIQVLGIALDSWDASVVELVRQKESTNKSSMSSNDRHTIAELISNYEIDEELAAQQDPERIMIFDDVLSAGNHFQAMQSVLQDRYPEADIFGVFLARRIFDDPDDD